MQKDRNVLIVSSEFPPGPGGIGNHAFNLARNFSKLGFRTSVIAPIRDQFIKNTKRTINDGQFLISYFNKRKYKVFNVFELYFLIFKKIFSNKQTIIATGTVPLILTGLIPGFFIDKKIGIIHGHETILISNVKKILISNCLKQFDKLIAVSNFSKSRVTDFYPSISVNVINNGADFGRFKKIEKIHAPKKNKLNIITIGTLSYRKGQHNVINALPEINKRFENVLYHMVGMPNIEDDLIKIAQNLGVLENIKVHGVLDDKDLNELISDSDIFMMLSENLKNGDVEGFGIAIIEANYMGLPAIGSMGCGIEDAIDNNKSGILVDNKDVKSIANAVEDIIDRYKDYSNYSSNWAKNFDWKDVIIKYNNLL